MMMAKVKMESRTKIEFQIDFGLDDVGVRDCRLRWEGDARRGEVSVGVGAVRGAWTSPSLEMTSSWMGSELEAWERRLDGLFEGLYDMTASLS